MGNVFKGRNGVALAVALSGALLTGLYLFSQDKEFAADVVRALFGLSGGNTVGG